MAERLLDDQADPALGAPPLAELVDDRLEGGRRDGEVVEAVARAAALLVEVVQRVDDAVLALVVGEVGGDVAHPLGQLAPDLRVEVVAGVLADRLLHLRDPLLRRLLGAGDADDAEALRQQPAQRERVERREDLPPRQVAGRAEDDDRARVRAAPEPQALEQRIAVGGASSPRVGRLLRRLHGLDGVAAELVSQRGLHLGGEVDLAPRGEAGEERGADRGQRHGARRSPR